VVRTQRFINNHLSLDFLIGGLMKMKIPKIKIKPILIVGSLVSAAFIGTFVGHKAYNHLSSSKDYSAYKFNDKIGNEHVEFNQLFGNNTLTITKSDGTIIKYMDKEGNDLKIESVWYKAVDEDGKRVHSGYYKLEDEIESPVVEKAQNNFDYYLGKIKSERLARGNKVLNR